MEELSRWSLTEIKKELRNLATEIIGDGKFTADDVETSIKILERLENLKMKAAAGSSSEMGPISTKLVQDPVVSTSGHDSGDIELRTPSEDSADFELLTPLQDAGDVPEQNSPYSPDDRAHADDSLIMKPSFSSLPDEKSPDPPDDRAHVDPLLMKPSSSSLPDQESPNSPDDRACVDPLLMKPSSSSLPDQEAPVSPDDRAQADSLLMKLSSSSPQDRKSAAKDLRALRDRLKSFDAVFGDPTEAIDTILSPLVVGHLDSADPDLRVDLLGSLLNLSSTENIKNVMGEHATVIPLLIDSLRCGPTEARSNAAATLHLLSSIDSNKKHIVEAGGIAALIELLQQTDHSQAFRNAIPALHKLLYFSQTEIQERAIEDGLIRMAMQKIEKGELADQFLLILATLLKNSHAVREMGEHGAVRILTKYLPNARAACSKQVANQILYSMVVSDNRWVKEIRANKDAIRTIMGKDSRWVKE